MSDTDQLLNMVDQNQKRGRRGSFSETIQKGVRLSRETTKRVSDSKAGQVTGVVAKDLFVFALDAIKDFLASVGGALIALGISTNNSAWKVFGLAIAAISISMISDVVPKLNARKEGVQFEVLNLFFTMGQSSRSTHCWYVRRQCLR